MSDCRNSGILESGFGAVGAVQIAGIHTKNGLTTGPRKCNPTRSKQQMALPTGGWLVCMYVRMRMV